MISIDSTFRDKIVTVEHKFVGFDTISMRIIDRSNYRERSKYKTDVNYLLLRENAYVDLVELKEQYNFDTLIVSSENGKNYKRDKATLCDSLQIAHKKY